MWCSDAPQPGKCPYARGIVETRRMLGTVQHMLRRAGEGDAKPDPAELARLARLEAAYRDRLAAFCRAELAARTGRLRAD